MEKSFLRHEVLLRLRETAHNFAQTLMRVSLDLITFLGIFYWVRGSHYQRDQNVLFRIFFGGGKTKSYYIAILTLVHSR